MKTQLAVSKEANLQDGTWTFKIDNMISSTGEFMIIPFKKYEDALLLLESSITDGIPSSTENDRTEFIRCALELLKP